MCVPSHRTSQHGAYRWRMYVSTWWELQHSSKEPVTGVIFLGWKPPRVHVVKGEWKQETLHTARIPYHHALWDTEAPLLWLAAVPAAGREPESLCGQGTGTHWGNTFPGSWLQYDRNCIQGISKERSNKSTYIEESRWRSVYSAARPSPKNTWVSISMSLVRQASRMPGLGKTLAISAQVERDLVRMQ